MLHRLTESAASLAYSIRQATSLFFGSPLRALVSAGSIAAVVGYAYGTRSVGSDEQLRTELEISLYAASYVERTARDLQGNRESERSRRRIAEKTAAALASDIRGRDAELLDANQKLAFYEQLLAERGEASADVSIRSFTIEPDFRESSYRANTVLARGGTIDTPFAGRLDLKLSITDAEGNERVYTPVVAEADLLIEFRYYLEKEIVFRIPVGHEIANAQLLLSDSGGAVLAAIPLFTPEP